jgi:hypothetical protein
MNQLSRYGFAAMLTIGAGIGLTPSSEARSVSGFLGQPQNPADYACFSNGNGIVFNTCATTKRFCVALPIDTSSSTVTVTIAGSASGPARCFAQSVNRAGAFVAVTPTVSEPLWPPVTRLLGTLSVPFAGGFYTCCDLPTNAQLASVNW